MMIKKKEKNLIFFPLFFKVIINFFTYTYVQERALAESFSDFIDYGLLLLQNHRSLFPPGNDRATEKLEYLLR